MDKKLSFSISTKSAASKVARNTSKPAHTFSNNEGSRNEEPSHRYVTEFDSNDKSVNLNDNSSQSQKLVIAPIQNEYRPGKRMKNLDLPLRSAIAGSGGELNFEVDNSADVANEAAGANISFGLNIRQSEKEDGAGYDDGQHKGSVDGLLLKKLKDDISRLPEDEGFEQFEEVPVEDFAKALMAGYGWKEGMGIGKRNANKDLEVVQYKRWVGREGLGAFTEVAGNANKREVGSHHNNGGKTEKESGREVGSHHNNGGKTEKESGREVGSLHNNGGKTEKESGREGKRISSRFLIGKEVRITGGPDMGLKGRVMEELPSEDLLVLELSSSKEQVKVFASDVAELGSAKEEKCLQEVEELRHQELRAKNQRADKRETDSATIRTDKERKASKRSAEGRRKDDAGYVKRDSVKRGDGRASKVSWLRSHIRVRIISKHFKGGVFYLKKGEVLDVIGPTTCDISMDDNREIIQGVEQDILETALPRRGGPVIVLSGKHKGAYGNLVEKDGESETGVVQDADTQELLNVHLEQIAEFVGDPSCIGY